MLPLATILLALATLLFGHVFKAHQKWLLHQQLLALTKMDTGGMAKSNERLVNFVDQMVNEQKEACLQAQEPFGAAKGPKLPSTYWGVDTIHIRCTLCNVENKVELLQLWLPLANAGKCVWQAMEMVLTHIAHQKI
jgi:hypothetical protein